MASKANKTSFKPGNPGGPGRPPRETESEYLEAVVGAVPLARWRKVILRAVADAEKGDPRARDFLARFLLPKDPGVDPIEALLRSLEK
ncbi:MAG: hypothetical protein IT462_03700 [Planctomycetes bacterium]|nr:hypothetical protein [Planctomycetota bacterium]